ncbi:MAG: DUF692 family multinuclear iron-containing protein [Chloroflexota bacterium]
MTQPANLPGLGVQPGQGMQFAINFSHPAKALFSAGRLPLDRFKTPDWPEMVAEAAQLRPVQVHFNLKAGCGKLDKVDWAVVDRLLEDTGTPYVNVHLESEAGCLPGVPQHSARPEHREAVIERMLADLQPLLHRYGAPRVIAENIPYRPASRVILLCADPQVISTVIETSGIGLLLDISHARISAHHLGMDWRAYISQLPVHRLRELHVTGIADQDGWLQDHRPLQPDDWPAVDWVLERIRAGVWPQPWLMAFEYGGVGGKFSEFSDPQVIEQQGSQLHHAAHHLARAL